MEKGKQLAVGAIAVAGAFILYKVLTKSEQKQDIPYDLKIVSYRNVRTDTIVTAGNTLTCDIGDTVEVNISFMYFGKAQTAKYHVADYVMTLNTINEITMVEQSLSIPAKEKATEIRGTVNLVLTEPSIFESSSDKKYGLYCKIEGIDLVNIVQMDKVILLSNAKAPVNVGQWGDQDVSLNGETGTPISIVVKDPNQVNKGTLNVSLTPSNASLVLGGQTFVPGSYQLIAGTYEWSCTALGYTSTTGTAIIAEGRSTDLTIVLVKVPSSLEITNSPVQGGYIYFTARGMTPNSGINVYVDAVLVSSGDFATDYNGEVNGFIVAQGSVGTHMMGVEDANVRVQADFTITAGEVILDYFWVYVTNYSNSNITFFACQYLDEVTGEWVDGGINSVYNFATFLSVHNHGQLSISLYNATYEAWGDWFNLGSMTMYMKSYYFNCVTRALTHN